MRRNALLALSVLAVATIAGATTSTSYAQPTSHALSLATFATLPLQLSAGPDGATVSSTGTSSSATLAATPGGVLDATSNNTILTDPSATLGVQIRLVFQSASNFASRCNPCKLQLRNGSTTLDEITMTNGAPAAGTAGPWVAVNATQSWAIWGDVRATLGNKNCPISYWIEIQSASGSTEANYTQMQMTFVV
jgi:hypothetical protein